MVKKHTTFKQLSDLLDIPVAELQFFNPSYKRNEIPSIQGENNFLRLPKDKIAIYTSNEDKIYAYIDYESNKREKPNVKEVVIKSNDSLNNNNIARTKYHKVRRGENLGEIAEKYNVALSDLKKWNGIKGNTALLGRNLKILSTEKTTFKENNNLVVSDSTALKKDIEKQVEVANAEPKIKKVYTTDKVVVNKEIIKYHKVKRGEGLGKIADKYEVSIAEIKKWNKIKGNNIGLGDNLKIISIEKVTTLVKKEVNQPYSDKNQDLAVVDHKKSKSDVLKKEVKTDTTQKTDSFYVVVKGDNLFSIAKKYNLAVNDIKEWNGMIDSNVKEGTKLLVSNNGRQNQNDVLSNSEEKTIEHLVGKGEFLGTIARKYNTTINDLIALNSLSDTNIKQGDKLIVGKENTIKKANESYAESSKIVKTKLYQVRRGDTLSSISKQFPGVTIADLKKWNGIKGENIQPGMKLKIGG